MLRIALPTKPLTGYSLNAYPVHVTFQRNRIATHKGQSPGLCALAVESFVVVFELLGKHKAEQWFALKKLKARRANSRRRAIQKLGADGGTEVVDSLCAMLSDPDETVRIAAARAVANRNGPEVTRSLCAALGDTQPAVRLAIIEALQQVCDTEAAPALVSALKDADASVRRQAVRALEALRWQPKTEAERVSRDVAAGHFGKAVLAGAAAIETLALLARSGSDSDRRAAVESLAKIGDERVPKLLIEALKDSCNSVRRVAVEALSELTDPQIIEPLLRVLNDDDLHIREAAVEGLTRSNDERAAEPVLKLLGDQAWDVRLAVVRGMGKMRHAPAVPLLLPMLQDPDHDVRRATAEALGQIRDFNAIGPLVLALTDEQSAVRSTAAAALGRIDERWEKSAAAQSVTSALKAALNSQDYAVRQGASQALQKIMDVPSPSPSANSLSQPSKYTRRAALDCLLEILEDEHRDLRRAAAEALGRFGEKQSIPLLSKYSQDPDPDVARAATYSLLQLLQ